MKKLKGQGRIYRRGDIYWIEYWYRGKQYRESGRSRKEGDAHKLLKKRLGEIHGKTFVGPKEERVTVEELLQDLVTDYQVRGRKSLSTLLPRLKAVRAAFGMDRAVDMTTPCVRRVIASWQAEGASSATINRRIAAVARAFVLGKEAGKLTTVPRFPTLEENNARQGFFERSEFLTVLAPLPDQDLRDFTEWAFWTGMRKGESASLTWPAFDRETWTLRLHAKDAKSKKSRVLPLVGPLRAVIERRLKARRLDCPLIFHRNGHPIKEFRKSWQRACRATGLQGKKFHDLRRTGVRNLVRAGVPQSVAMAISGHQTASVFRRYDITSDQDLREAVAKVSAYVESLPTTPTVTPLPVASEAGSR